jgi:ABC-type multidrug transport system fused ATPase/permease subunit
VLVFDEATSALDNETEAAVMGAIQSLDRDLTILIIAHRVSTVAGCDKVVKLDAGHVVAEGLPKVIINSETDQISHSTSISRPKKHA